LGHRPAVHTPAHAGHLTAGQQPEQANAEGNNRRRWYTFPVPSSVISAPDRARWHEDGWCVLDGFFADEELSKGHEAARRLFPSPEQVAAGTT
jgi:hypothetical protein